MSSFSCLLIRKLFVGSENKAKERNIFLFEMSTASTICVLFMMFLTLDQAVEIIGIQIRKI